MIRNFKDHANNERTFLAWVRTATTIVGFGLAAGRIGGAVPPLWTELALFASGFLLVVVAFGRMVWLRRRIERSDHCIQHKVRTKRLILVGAGE